MKIGIFGGSFNPIHKRHEEIAKFLLNGYVDKIIFVPTGCKYEYKNNLIDNKYRLDMIKLVTDKNPNMMVSDYEMKDYVVYTCDTLDYFSNLYPEDEIYFICGSDNLSYIDKWKNGEYLLKNYKFLVIERNTNLINELLIQFLEYKDNIIVVNMDLSDLSSTYIRKNVLDKDIVKYLDSEVYQYILDNQLYINEV